RPVGMEWIETQHAAVEHGEDVRHGEATADVRGLRLVDHPQRVPPDAPGELPDCLDGNRHGEIPLGFLWSAVARHPFGWLSSLNPKRCQATALQNFNSNARSRRLP